MIRPCPWNHHKYPQLADTMMCSKKTNDHGFGNELEAKYWLRLKFSFPPEASRPVHALSILNGRVPGSAIPLLYNMLCSANANIKAPLCSACRVEVRLWPQPSPRGGCSWWPLWGWWGRWESPAHFIVRALASTYSIGSSGLKGRDLCPMRNCLNGQTETEISESVRRKTFTLLSKLVWGATGGSLGWA